MSDAHLVLMLGMAAVCLPCATHLVPAPSARTWLHAGVLSAGMLLAHWLLAGLVGSAGHQHPVSGWWAVAHVGVVLGPVLTLCLALAGAAVQRRVTGVVH
ncbi:hypothetical protein [Blastococcus sp. SYSU DS0616]